MMLRRVLDLSIIYHLLLSFLLVFRCKEMVGLDFIRLVDEKLAIGI